MFRRTESDGVLELRMIDFQECMLTRPNADLACLVLNSVLPGDREEHLQAGGSFQCLNPKPHNKWLG